MKAKPYWDTSHPRSPLYRRLVQRGFEIMYPHTRYDEFGRMIDMKPLKPQYITHLVAKENRAMDELERAIDGEDGGASKDAGGAVHVQSHAREGGKVEVSDYWRARPGEGSGSEQSPESPKARNLLDDAENAGVENDAGDTQAGTDDGRPKSRSPVPNPVIRDDLEGDGRFGTSRKGHLHEGIDVLAKPGEEVVSPVDGEVNRITDAYKSGPLVGQFNAITIDGDDGREYKFLYVAPKDGDGNILVKDKDRVSAGDPIGTVQDRAAREPSGKMENHIHIEIRDESGKVVDPTPDFERWRNQGGRSDSSNETSDQSSSGPH